MDHSYGDEGWTSAIGPMLHPSALPQVHARRRACDRCRSYKLRCEKDTSPTGYTGDCKRCSKAHAICKVSPSLQMGRPRVTKPASPPHSPTPTPGGTCSPLNTNLVDIAAAMNSASDESQNGARGQDYGPDACMVSAAAQSFYQDFTAGTYATPDFAAGIFAAPVTPAQNASYQPKAECPLTPQQPNIALDALTTLNELLLKQRGKPNNQGHSDMNASIQSPSHFFPEPTPHTPIERPAASIGHVLKDSQRFLDILQHYLDPTTSSTYSNTNCSSLFFEDVSPYLHPPATEKRASLDLYIALLLLSSFTCLNRLHRSLTTDPQKSLRQELPTSLQSSNLLIASIDLDGFKLNQEQHSQLQIKILLQVSTDMLQRVRQGMKTLFVEAQDGEQGVLPAMWELVLRQDQMERDQSGE